MGAVFRIEKTKDFTVMSNHHLRNTNLSLKAKGLLIIDYATGNSWVDEAEPAQAEMVTRPTIADENTYATYILNTNTKKFHYDFALSTHYGKTVEEVKELLESYGAAPL